MHPSAAKRRHGAAPLERMSLLVDGLFSVRASVAQPQRHDPCSSVETLLMNDLSENEVKEMKALIA